MQTFAPSRTDLFLAIAPYILLATIALSLSLASPAVAIIDSSEKSSIDNAPNFQSAKLDLAFKLFAEESKHSKGNIVISPFSAYSALCMTMNGAAGETRTQILKVLGLADEKIEETNQRNQKMLATLACNKSIQLELSNAIYSDISNSIKNNFSDTCKTFYGAQANSIDFSAASSISTINSWCNEKTDGKIPVIIDKLSKSSKILVLDAVYFKGKLANCFEKAKTTDDRFSVLKGQTTPVKMMHRKGEISYFKDRDFQAVSLPYEGKKQSMLIFLPNKGVDFERFRTKFKSDKWMQWLSLFQAKEVNLSLPRFKVQFSADLASTLKTIGMPEAFSDKADFSNMIAAPADLHIGKVVQKIYLDVEEEGTEAAAITEVEFTPRDLFFEKPKSVEFRVDHPFVFALVDDETKEVFFIGSIDKP